MAGTAISLVAKELNGRMCKIQLKDCVAKDVGVRSRRMQKVLRVPRRRKRRGNKEVTEQEGTRSFLAMKYIKQVDFTYT